jgi:hypothetical protein
VIFHTKYPKKFCASLRNWKKIRFFGVKSWFFTFFYDFSIGFGTVLAWYFFVFHFMVWGKKFSICASNFKILNFVASVFMNNTHEWIKKERYYWKESKQYTLLKQKFNHKGEQARMLYFIYNVYGKILKSKTCFIYRSWMYM